MQLGIGKLKELKLGKDPNNEKDVDEGLESSETEESNISLPKLAHFGFHVHPTKTPTTTATQRGAIKIISSPSTSTILGLPKISAKTEIKAIPNRRKKKMKQNKKKNPQIQSNRWASKHIDYSRVSREEEKNRKKRIGRP